MVLQVYPSVSVSECRRLGDLDIAQPYGHTYLNNQVLPRVSPRKRVPFPSGLPR